MQRRLILVVDDDEAVRESLRFSLSIEGFAVRVFPNGGQLLAEAPLSSGDCLVIDQNMPDMSGFDLISTLRARNVTAPAILILSRPDPALRARAALAGICIVEKPLLDFTLVESVRRVLAGPPGTHVRS